MIVKMKITGKEHGEGKGRPIVSYIIQKDNIKGYKVTKKDCIKLIDSGLVEGRILRRDNSIVTKEKIREITKDTARQIEFTGYEDIIREIFKKELGERLDGSIELEIYNKSATSKRGMYTVKSAVVDKSNSMLIGYVYSDGSVLKIKGHKNISNKYKKTITQTCSMVKRLVLEGKTVKETKIDDVHDFVDRFSDSFKIQTVSNGGGPMYVKIELFRMWYTKKQADSLLKNKVIDNILYVDKEEHIEYCGKNRNKAREIASKLGLNNDRIEKIEDEVYIYHDENYSPEVVIKINSEIEKVIQKVIATKARYGVTTVNDLTLIYDIKINKLSIYTKCGFNSLK